LYGFTKIATDRAQQAAESNRFLNYFEEFVTTTAHEETGVFGYEWNGKDFSGNYIRDYCGKKPYEDGRLTFKMVKGAFERIMGQGGAASYIDFVCWHGRKLMERGLGLYFDNSFLKRSRNTLATAAYRLPASRGGGIQPSSLVWWHREYFKRMWQLERLHAPEEGKPWLEVHMTNANIVPYIGFMDSSLDLEWWAAGPKIMQKRYPAALLRTETTGLQTGNIPKALMNLPKEMPIPERKTVATRTRFGTRVVHEIRAGSGEDDLWRPLYEFGYARPDCEVYNYWDHDNPLRVEPAEVKTLLLARNGKLLLALCSWSDKKEKAQVRFTDERLLKDKSGAVDVEHPESSRPHDEVFEQMLGNMEEDEAGLGTPMKGVKPDGEVPGARFRRENISGAFGFQGKIEFKVPEGRMTVPLAPYGVRVIRVE
jgi:hypothetical protein